MQAPEIPGNTPPIVSGSGYFPCSRIHHLQQEPYISYFSLSLSLLIFEHFRNYSVVYYPARCFGINSGINFLYFSAGLSNIDETIYERASVDGASSLQKFYRLTLPGLAPMMFYTLVVNIIQAFQSFGQVKILTQGGPGESTNLIGSL